MPVELIEPLDFGAIRFGISINWIAIERVSNRFVFADDPLQMRGCNVIVVVVATPAVAAEFVKLTCQKRVGSPIILDRIENGYSVRSQGNRATKEMRLG